MPLDDSTFGAPQCVLWMNLFNLDTYDVPIGAFLSMPLYVFTLGGTYDVPIGAFLSMLLDDSTFGAPPSARVVYSIGGRGGMLVFLILTSEKSKNKNPRLKIPTF